MEALRDQEARNPSILKELDHLKAMVNRLQRQGMPPAQLQLPPCLLDLYASTRADELAQVPWSDDQKRAFVAQQFEAQQRAYHAYENATLNVIVEDGDPIGRLYVARWPAEIRIMDIAVVPGHRNRGIGTALIRELQQEAAASDRPLTIHVERFNLALKLYERMGFQVAAERDHVYLLMRWEGA